MWPVIVVVSVCVWFAAIVWRDWRVRAIDNVLTLPALLLGIAWFAFTGEALVREGLAGTANALSMLGTTDGWAGVPLGLLLALLLGLPGFIQRSFGGGDVKLLLALAALGGPAPVFLSMLSAAVVAVVVRIGGGAVRGKFPFAVYAIPGIVLWIALI